MIGVKQGGQYVIYAVAFASASASAQEATTFAANFAVPAFDQIDGNGVDLVSGVWRIRTPSVVVGNGDDKYAQGLQWTGQAWNHVGHPSLWRSDGKYIVMYKSASYEFNGFSSSFSKVAPIDGSTLSCDTLVGGSGITYCRFRSRDGDFVVFSGFYSQLSNYGDKFGFSALEFGNVGIQSVHVSEIGLGSPPIGRSPNHTYYAESTLVKKWGYQNILYGMQVADPSYYNQTRHLFLWNTNNAIRQRIIIYTPNNDDSNDHYLLPESTTQTFTDDFGKVWSYTFNGNRDLIAVNQPGGIGGVSATYNGDHKVTSITTQAGAWTYTYANSSISGFKTTTVTDPNGGTTFVRYHAEHKYVSEVIDSLGRTTSYNWDSNSRRLLSIMMPEGNSATFEYDDRGNVTRKREFTKDGLTEIQWQAGYPTSCPNGGNCNQPAFVIDPKMNRTDFEYGAPSLGPTKITYAASTPGLPKRIVRREYSAGKVIKSSYCRTLESCAGTSDEVVEEYYYSHALIDNPVTGGGAANFSFIGGPISLLIGKKVTADSQSLLTCYQYDASGRRVMETPPSANLTSCPNGVSSTALPGSNPPESGSTKTIPVLVQ